MKKITDVKVGDCFSNGPHYYMVRAEDTLHVGAFQGPLLNTLEQDHIEKAQSLMGHTFKRISKAKFVAEAKKCIFELDINEFWNK